VGYWKKPNRKVLVRDGRFWGEEKKKSRTPVGIQTCNECKSPQFVKILAPGWQTIQRWKEYGEYCG